MVRALQGETLGLVRRNGTGRAAQVGTVGSCRVPWRVRVLQPKTREENILVNNRTATNGNREDWKSTEARDKDKEWKAKWLPLLSFSAWPATLSKIGSEEYPFYLIKRTLLI